MDVAEWLGELGLGQYAAAFEANAIDVEVLRQLTAEDLTALGVTAIGHRRKLLSAIASLSEEAKSQSAPPAKKSEPAPVAQSGGERRQVAVLFADLVGYTTLTQQLGAEAMYELLDAYFRCVDAVIERLGGRVDKHMGDCVMAVFGAPVARGNDAERAVMAAVEIREAVQALAADRRQDIAVHVGVTLGSVVASYIGAGRSAEYAITGDSVNLASRLTGLAGRNEILISDALYRVVPGLLCEPSGEHRVKGMAQPVVVWRLLGRRRESGQRRPLAGRRRELRQFEAVLRTCLEEGTGQVALLRGEPGIGKTRLTEEFERLAQAADFACHRGLVLDFGGETGRDAVRTIVRDLLGVDLKERGDALQEVARKAVAEAVVPADYEVHLNDLLDAPQPEHLRADYDAMDNQRRQEGRAQTLAQLLRWSTARQPRLLIVEDVHWAKPPLLRALASLGRTVGTCPAVLVLTARLEGDPLDKTWRATLGGAPFTTIDLGPLREEDARQICEAEGAEPAAAAALIERAGGNPLFLEQLLRHLESDGSSVPGTVQSLVQATIDQLSPADKATIQAASVIGQQVDVDLLNVLAERPDGVPAGLIERGLLRPHGRGYLFVHALIREAVYHSLLQSARRVLHRRAADWFERRDERLRAEHLALAEAPEAAAAFLAAARAEIARYHDENALALIDRGLALANDPKDRVALLLQQGETLHNLGRFADARPVFTAALEAASSPLHRCQALIGLAALKRMSDDLDGALGDLAAAQQEAAEQLLPEQARIHTLRGNLLFPRGDLEGCLREHEAGLHFAQLAGRPELEAAALGGLGDAEYVRGRMASARRRLEQCVALARRLGLGRIEVANHAQVAHTMIYSATMREFLATATEAREAASRVGHIRAGINAALAVVIAQLNLGRYEEALATLSESEVVIERSGIVRFRQSSLLWRGRLLDRLGRIHEARSALREGLDFAASNGFAFHGPSLASALASVATGRDEALELLKQAEAAIAKGCVGHNQYLVYIDGLDVAFRLEDQAKLRRYVALLESFTSGEPVSWADFHLLRGRALLHRLEHPGSNDDALLQEAQERCLALDAHRFRLF